MNIFFQESQVPLCVYWDETAQGTYDAVYVMMSCFIIIMTSQQGVKVIGARRDVRELVTSFWTG